MISPVIEHHVRNIAENQRQRKVLSAYLEMKSPRSCSPFVPILTSEFPFSSCDGTNTTDTASSSSDYSNCNSNEFYASMINLSNAAASESRLPLVSPCESIISRHGNCPMTFTNQNQIQFQNSQTNGGNKKDLPPPVLPELLQEDHRYNDLKDFKYKRRRVAHRLRRPFQPRPRKDENENHDDCPQSRDHENPSQHDHHPYHQIQPSGTISIDDQMSPSPTTTALSYSSESCSPKSEKNDISFAASILCRLKASTPPLSPVELVAPPPLPPKKIALMAMRRRSTLQKHQEYHRDHCSNASPRVRFLHEHNCEDKEGDDTTHSYPSVLPKTQSCEVRSPLTFDQKNKNKRPCDSHKRERSSSSSSLPLSWSTEFPTRLALPNDFKEVNSLHCYVRSELLELYVVPPQGAAAQPEEQHHRRQQDIMNNDDDDEEDENPARTRSRNKNASSALPPQGTTTRRNTPGRVGLRCVYCAHICNRKKVSTKADFYPKSIEQLYREVCTWQRVHFHTCKHIPDSVRSKYKYLKESDKTRGKTRYWENSARDLGLVNVFSAGNCNDGIQFKL